jgi:hypothetical protein
MAFNCSCVGHDRGMNQSHLDKISVFHFRERETQRLVEQVGSNGLVGGG